MPAITPPISSQALTLADWAMLSENPRIKKLTECFLSDVSILDFLPLVNSPQFKVRGARMDATQLPPTGWGAINMPPTDVKSVTTTYEETAAMIRERVQVDTALLREKSPIQDPIRVQATGAMAGIRYDMNHAFFYNNPTQPQQNDYTQPYTLNEGELAWPGLKWRLANPLTYSLPRNANGTSTLQIAAGGTSGINARPNLTASDANNFLEAITQAFAYLGASDGRGCVIFTNWLMKARIERAIRTLGAGAGFTTTKDAYDREISMLNGAKVVDMGFRRDNVQAPIISNTLDINGNETGVVGTGNYSELFVVRFGDDYMKGWKAGNMDLEDLGRSSEYGTYHNFLIDIMIGLAFDNYRSFVNLTGFQLT